MKPPAAPIRGARRPPAPRLVRVQDPFSKLLGAACASFAHIISAASLLEAAERD